MAFRNPKRRRKARRVAKLRDIGKAVNDLAAVAPDAAVKVLMRSFVYPQRRVPTDEQGAVLAGAEQLRMPFGRTALQVYRWRGDGSAPTVLLLHDWEQHSGYFAEYVPALTDKGCTVVALDAPASGLSGGRRLSLREYINALHGLRARLGGFDSAVGHGLGAAALLQAAAQWPAAQRPGRIAALGVYANSRDLFKRRLSELDVDPLVHDKFWRKLGRTRDVPLSAYDNTQAVARLGEVEGLLLHDAQDARYPLADAEALAEAWPSAELTVLEGFGHKLRGRDVVARVLPFVSARKLTGVAAAAAA